MAGRDENIDTSVRLRIQQRDTKKIEEKIKNNLLTLLSEKDNELKPYEPAKQETNITHELTRRESIKNDAMAQDIGLKGKTLFILFIFLAIETGIIFSFALLQGTHWLGFKLEEWSFKLLIGATILQITYMLQIAVKYLFPNKG